MQSIRDTAADPAHDASDMPDAARPVALRETISPLQEDMRRFADTIAAQARGGEWPAVLDTIARLDHERARTEALKRLAELALYAARRGALGPAGSAGPFDLRARRALGRLDRLAAALAPYRHRPEAATLLARAALDIAATRPEGRCAAQARSRAHAWLAPFDPDRAGSPLLAGAFYRLAETGPAPGAELARRFALWNDLDPGNPVTLARHAVNLLPDRHGSAQEIEIAARQAALHSAAELGYGGYALFYCDELFEREPALVSQIDIGFYLDAVEDIARRTGAQPLVNHFAAALLRLAEAEDRLAEMGSRLAPARAADFRAGFARYVSTHLDRVTPAIWGRPERAVLAALHRAGRAPRYA